MVVHPCGCGPPRVFVGVRVGIKRERSKGKGDIGQIVVYES